MERCQFTLQCEWNVVVRTVDVCVVVDAINSFNPLLGLNAFWLLVEDEELGDYVFAQVCGFAGVVVLVYNHHEGHEARAVEVLALVVGLRAVLFAANVNVVFERLLGHLAEREVVH